MKHLKIIAFFILLPTIFGLIPAKTEAAKNFVSKKKAGAKTITRSIPAVVRYRPDRLAILLSFANFNGIESVAYSFTYDTNGIPQGAGGVVTTNNNPTQVRELLFGTCSTNVCTYHYNLSKARLVLTAKYTNGKTAGKAYRIKTYR